MKRITYLFIVCFIALPTLNSCITGKNIKGNSTIASKEIDISDYDAIVLQTNAKVIYKQMPSGIPLLQVSIDENLLSLLDISVSDRRLIISKKSNISVRPTQFIVHTNSTALNKVNICGSGNILLPQQVNTQQMEMSISGSGNIKADSLFCENLNLKISGSGYIELQGSANNAKFSINGSGKIRAFGFLSQEIKCSISGSGNIEVNAGKQIDTSISGSGNIKYKGNPETVNVLVSGSGNVQKVSQ